MQDFRAKTISALAARESFSNLLADLSPVSPTQDFLLPVTPLYRARLVYGFV